MDPTNQINTVVYSLRVTSVWKTLLMLIILALSFVLALFLMISIKPWFPEGTTAMIILGAVACTVPFVTHRVIRGRFRSSVKVKLSQQSIEFQWPNRSTMLASDDIANYYTVHFEDEDDDATSVTIRAKAGTKIRLSATTRMGSIKEMERFRTDFEQWAKAHKLSNEVPWYHKNFFF